mmetsp:Transcript_4639/g.16947  ORF Transcript_4639/g.16947 Transcript_4639/m.16947 type:complete len:211 (-) Transcript_4639:1422-2054(-)
MHDIVSNTNAAFASLGNHGEFNALKNSNPNKHAAGRTPKRTMHAAVKARMSGKGMLNKYAIAARDLAQALPTELKTLNVVHLSLASATRARDFASSSSGPQSEPRAAALAARAMRFSTSSGVIFTKLDAKTSICPGNAAAPMLAASSNNARNTTAMNDKYAGKSTVASAKFPTNTSFNGVAPINTPAMIPNNGGFNNSFPMRPIVALVVK